MRNLFVEVSVEGRILSATIRLTPSGKVYVSILTEQEVQPLPAAPRPAVGMDLGIKHFAVLSTGEQVDNPKYLRKYEKQLARAQRTLSRRKKGGSNWEKARRRVITGFGKTNPSQFGSLSWLSSTRMLSLVKDVW